MPDEGWLAHGLEGRRAEDQMELLENRIVK